MMELSFETMLYGLLGVATAWFAYITWNMNSNFDYWKKRRVPYVKPVPYFGNFKDVLLSRKSMGLSFQDLYNKLEGHKFGGLFRSSNPLIILRDPELIRHVMVKDFQHFHSRGLKPNPKTDPLGQHLFALSGPIWHSLRTKLTPTFTSGKMKMMFELMKECSQQLTEYLAKDAEKGSVVEMKEVVAKFTTDIIGTCAFGLQFNSMTDPNSEFRKMGRRIFQLSGFTVFRRFIIQMMPKLAGLLNISFIDKDVTKFFMAAVKETIDYRERNNIQRNDFLQLLIQLKNQGKVEDDSNDGTVDVKNHHDDRIELDDALLAAQVFVFFLAGFETSSTTMSFALYELALNPDIQDRLRDEIDATLEECNGRITYEAIQKMEYLDKVVAETLRFYPPVPHLQRACATPYKIPGTDVVIEKGVHVIIPIFAIQRDPKYYPNPDKFDPERFSEENKSQRHHYTYLPFGEGPRNCIGMRFGLLQSKLGLFTLLASYEFSVCEGTEIPLRFSPRGVITSSSTGCILKITKRIHK